MNPDIANLVKLQLLDDQIRALDSRLAQIPKEVAALEKEIADERKNLKDAEDALAEGQKAQRAADGELSSKEEMLSKYQTQLMSVKSNEEYKAMQKQIEVTKSEIGDVETKILQGLDTLEELEEVVKKRRKELEEGQKKVSGMEKELDDERKKLESERASRQASREEVVGVLPQDLLEEYGRIARMRNGVAMAEAIDERCQVCMVRIRPQVFQELRMGDKMHHCGSCGRILYFQEETAKA